MLSWRIPISFVNHHQSSSGAVNTVISQCALTGVRGQPLYPLGDGVAWLPLTMSGMAGPWTIKRIR